MPPTGRFATMYFPSVDPQQNLEIERRQGNEKQECGGCSLFGFDSGFLLFFSFTL